MERYMLAKDVARMLGIRTSTLRKWRTLGKGPRGWVHSGKTSVLYPLSGVHAFIATLDVAASTTKE